MENFFTDNYKFKSEQPLPYSCPAMLNNHYSPRPLSKVNQGNSVGKEAGPQCITNEDKSIIKQDSQHGQRTEKMLSPIHKCGRPLDKDGGR